MESRKWEEMNADCLIEIFMRLSLDDLLLTMPLVCKPWLDAVIEPACWKKLDFRQIDLLPWSNFSKKFTLHHHLPYFSFSYFLRIAVKLSYKTVTELRLPLKFTSLDDLIYASIECPNLKIIALPILSETDEVKIPELISKWKDLERLEMESKPSNFAELVKSISLQSRDFSGLVVSGSIRKEDASAIVCYLPKIKYLDLSKSYLPKEELLVILSGCKDLETLNVNDCIGFHGEDRDIIAKTSGIKRFSNEGCKLYYEYVAEENDWGNGYNFYGYII